MAKLKQKHPTPKEVRIKRLTLQLYQRGANVYLKLFYEGRSLGFSTGVTCSSKQLDKKGFIIKDNESATVYLQGLRSDFQRAFTDFMLTKRKPDLHDLKKVVLEHAGIELPKPTLIECLERFYKDEFEALSGIEYKVKSVEKKRYLVERIKQYVIEHHKNPFMKLTDVKAIDGKNLTTFCKRVYRHGHTRLPSWS